MSLLSKLFGNNARQVSLYQEQVEKINSLEKTFEAFSQSELKEKTEEFCSKIKVGANPKIFLPEAFALVREAAKRTLHQRHFDEQLIGGMVLSEGKIAEMNTGEGKTLSATLPAYFHALSGKGVHIVTVNDYLALRDTVWMGQIYHFLGLSVACIVHEAAFVYDPDYKVADKLEVANIESVRDEERDSKGSFLVEKSYLRPVSRREAYLADITYGTNNEFGFDYLKDNMVYDLSEKVQRGHYFSIVDEVDSILIDEARTPLIISAPDIGSSELYKEFARMAPTLHENEDFNIDEKRRAVSLTDRGMEKMEKALNLPDLYTEKNIRYVHHLEQALSATFLFKRDKDYIIKNGEVVIVDEFTGRLMSGRRYSEGLHQAIEAKEGVRIQEESRTLATITFQNYFRLYEILSGMTGTAQTSAEEFHKVYKLEVLSIPTHKPLIRQDLPDKIFKTEHAKLNAVVEKIKSCQNAGQPVLVGTVSIEKNEKLSGLLKIAGVPHKLLNAKNHEEEGAIIAQAGKKGAVTIATNMAGRGVDILLGGNPPDIAEAEEVKNAGGLFVIGTERHEARRIDNQLRGRSGRQGDPGASQFFVSLEDDVMRIFGGERIKNLMERLGVDEDIPIENKLVSNAIESAQSRIEGYNFDMRKYVLDYDDVTNKQRQTIYGLRNEILSLFKNSPEKLKEKSMETLRAHIEDVINFHLGESYEVSNTEEIFEVIKTMAVDDNATLEALQKLKMEKFESPEDLKKRIWQFIENKYSAKENEIGSDLMRQLEKILFLRIVDELWMDNLDQMEYMRAGIGLRAYGQRDPLVAYKNEAYKLFKGMQDNIRQNYANLILKVSQRKEEKPQNAMEKFSKNSGGQNLSGKKEVGRNDPCPCGSGKKYKKCHGR
jgi:preprotein translocase subunit SecA